MSITEIETLVESLPGVLTLRPAPGDGTPELAWGDLFFYYAPDGVLPPGQPFATVIVKDYPDEPPSGLGGGAFRVNVDAGRRGQSPPEDPTVRDQIMPHPVYAQLGWICVVQPGPASSAELEFLLREARDAAQRRWERRRA